MLAVGHAAVAARGCSSAAASSVTASTAVAVTADTDTDTNADGADCAESVSRECSPLIAPIKRVSHRYRVVESRSSPFRPASFFLCPSVCLGVSLFHSFTRSLPLFLFLLFFLLLFPDISANGQKGVLRAR